ELRDKLASLVAGEPAVVAGPSAPSEDALREDTLSALLNLGYPKTAAEKAIAQAMRDGAPANVQEVLRRSLRLLAKA
ncbi:hypothetical protein OFD71_42720, partial [Escherichia coli]|nr:hypothetical protein [Escherichia coli]